MKKRQDPKIVLVTGDVTIDWNIARIRQTEGIMQAWNADDITSTFYQRGGAAMLADLIGAVAADLNKNQANIKVLPLDLPTKVFPDDSRFNHSYAMWAPHSMDERSEKKVWRVQEFLGLNHAGKAVKLVETHQKPKKDFASPDIIVMSDANLGFRDNPGAWPMSLSSKDCKSWILVNTAQPVAQGQLWDRLYSNRCDNIIAVMTANDLRREQVQISRNLSWERTAQDLMWEFLYNPKLSKLERCAYVVVSFGTSGVLVYSHKSTGATLFFDPNAMEGEWGIQSKGSMIGYTSCLVASIARELLLDSIQPNLTRGIQSGISAMRLLHTEGYGPVNGNPWEITLACPIKDIAAKISENVVCVASAKVENPIQELSALVTPKTSPEKNKSWTFLSDKYPEELETLAEKIVRQGIETTLSGVPVGKWGELKTVDRQEIEALRSVSNLIREYTGRPEQTPLPIAVFGPPGSGKSFTVKQVANLILPKENKPLTFNLSQFGNIEDLYDAFHQVRDKALSGTIPLVFWDEFDTTFQGESLGWLRYFLSPMQDGKFQQGQIEHPIGRSIFVFAGGTSFNMERFGEGLDEKQKREVKFPDFVSRIRGFLNILGPNQQKDANTQDPYFVIRRAILLRSVLERLTPRVIHRDGNNKIADIDDGILRAFLLTKEYKHGARSLEAIVAVSQLSGKTRFERSSLPPETQLNLHVDSQDFHALMHQLEFTSYLIEKLAIAAHELFCENLRGKGWTYGEITNNRKKKHSSLLEFAGLPEDEKEQNRGNVRDILKKLQIVGYMIVPLRGNQSSAKFTKEEVETLSIREHKRWKAQKEAGGWRKTKKLTDRKDLIRKLHPDIVEWEELPEKEKEKDRVLIRGIPRILAKAGYMMVKK